MGMATHEDNKSGFCEHQYLSGCDKCRMAKLESAITHIDTLCNDNPFELDFRLAAAIKAAVELVEGK